MLLMAIDNQAISKHHQQAHDICTSVCRYICTLGACISFNRLTIESREGGIARTFNPISRANVGFLFLSEVHIPLIHTCKLQSLAGINLE